MKGYIVIILLLVGTAIGTFLFYDQHKNTPDLLDIISDGLDGIDKVLPENAYVYYDTHNVNHDIFTRARYVLAPRNLIIDKDKQADTLLSIIDTNHYKSLEYTILSRVVIQNKTEGYYFILSTVNE